MYSFEGEFRRKPEQNYAGASVHEPVSNLIQRARHEREKREVYTVNKYFNMSIKLYTLFFKEAKREQRRVIRVQSCVRSFLTRKQIKQHYRTLFDNNVSDLKNKPPTEQILFSLVKHLVFFHDRKIDSQRLVSVTCYFFFHITRP